MAELIKRLTVFVGSPSDCIPEREIVRGLVTDLNRELKALEIPIEFSVESSEDVSSGAGRPQEIIIRKIDTADIALFIFWHRLGTDAGKGLTGTQEEFEHALRQQKQVGMPRVLLYFKEYPVPYDVDPAQFQELRDFRQRLETDRKFWAPTFIERSVFKKKVRQALDEVARNRTGQTRESKTLHAPESATSWSEKRTQLLGIKAIAPIKDVFRKTKLKDRVFSIELLTESLQFKSRDRQKIVHVNRKGTSDALYAGPARKILCDHCLDGPEIIQWAKSVDQKIHEFLRGGLDYDLELRLDKCPFRWASGGVFPVVSFRGRTWTSFFFRDIWPVGWNIPLGASEVSDSLQNPWSFLWREFLEELLVLRAPPEDRAKQQIEWRRPVFVERPDLQVPEQLAETFSAEHVKMRKECDGIVLRPSKELAIDRVDLETSTTLEIHSALGDASFTDIFYVAVNPRELGIEIVAPMQYSLDDNDYLLDGEILKPEDRERELVRMPVALISHDYLRRSFGDAELDWDEEGSVLGADLQKEDIFIFDWDIKQRRAIFEGAKDGCGEEVKRYKKWHKKFASDFDKALAGGPFSEKLRKFTPASAKIATYFLS